MENLKIEIVGMVMDDIAFLNEVTTMNDELEGESLTDAFYSLGVVEGMLQTLTTGLGMNVWDVEELFKEEKGINIYRRIDEIKEKLGA